MVGKDAVTPELMLEQLLRAGGFSAPPPGPAGEQQCLVIPKTRQFDSSLRILDMIPYQVDIYLSNSSL